MKLGVAINDTWSFFNEIFEFFQTRHQTSLFDPVIKKVPLFQNRFNQFQYQQQLKNFLSYNDVVFFEWSAELLAHATALPKKSGIVTRLHRYEMYQWAQHIDWKKVDKVILVSKEKENEIIKNYPFLKNHTVIIPEAVNLNKFKFNSRPFHKQLGILCHISPRKRVYELILAFVEQKLPDEGYKLHIGGGIHPKFPDYYHATHQLVEKLGQQDNIIFYDHISDPIQWYQKIDIFLSNSFSEGLQVSPMEAMASGCYCLSHHWGGADELLPRENLFLTNEDMAAKIRTYAELSESEREHQKAALRDCVEKYFDIDKTKNNILDVVEQVFRDLK